MSASDTHYEHVEPRRHHRYRDPTEFDRIAFAMRSLRRLRPRRLTVAVYSAVSSMHVESWRDLRREGASTAMIGIPPDASREHIAYALAELAGVASVPYAVQMLLAEDARPGA